MRDPTVLALGLELVEAASAGDVDSFCQKARDNVELFMNATSDAISFVQDQLPQSYSSAVDALRVQYSNAKACCWCPDVGRTIFVNMTPRIRIP